MRSDRDWRQGRLTGRTSIEVEALEPRLCLAAVSFLPAASYPAAYDGAHALAIGDFNGDGWPDLALVQSDAVSIWLNQQNGTFALDHTYFIQGANAIAVSDFDRDGTLDLAVTGQNGSVNILFGNGDGTFLSTPQTYTLFVAGSTADLTSLATGDFNGDGAPDLAIGANAAGPLGEVIVLLNKGDGSFSTAAPYAGAYSVGHLNGDYSTVHAIAVEDYDLDHVLDLAVAVSETSIIPGVGVVDVPGYVSVLYGNTTPGSGISDGTFSQPFNFAAGTNPIALTTADFNADGFPDVAVANVGNSTNPGNVSVLLNDMSGALLPSGNLIAGDFPHSIVSADFNGDGTSDLAVSGYSGVLVRTGNGNGTFALPQTIQAGGGFGQMVVGDFNRDGQPDLAVINTLGSGGFSVLLNNTKPAVVPKVSAASYDYMHSPHSLSFTFNEDVSASAAALNVQDLTSGLPVAPAGYSFDAATHAATFTFAGPLPSASYRATLLASGVSDSSGVHPAADYPFSFFFQIGDVNHDGKVDFTDFVTLARNYGKSGAAYADGDLDYDGKVDFNDLVILARHYGQSVPTAAALTPTLADDLLALPLKRRARAERR